MTRFQRVDLYPPPDLCPRKPVAVLLVLMMDTDKGIRDIGYQLLLIVVVNSFTPPAKILPVSLQVVCPETARAFVK